MNLREFYAAILLVIISVAALATMWEWFIEGLIISNVLGIGVDEESIEVKLEFIITSVLFTLLSLIIPIILGHRLINKNNAHQAQLSQSNLALEKKIAQRTEEIQYSQQLEQQANHAKSIFLANMSHEMRTPLTAIIGYTELISDEIKDSKLPEIAQDIRRIQLASNHLLGLSNNIYLYSKIQSGDSELKLQHFDVLGLIEQVQANTEPLITLNSNKLVVDLRDDKLVIYSDLLKLRQILINIISNAAKFTENGVINFTIECKLIDKIPFIQFVIRDTGIGIPEKDLNIIFLEFKQSDIVIQKRIDGNGLGLSIAKKYTELLGGKISVTSKINEGSAFTVSIPKDNRSLA